MNYYFKPGEMIKTYTILTLLGEGRYGIVYLAKGTDRKKYVIKQLKNEMLRSTEDKLFYERETMKMLNDSCFPRFMGTFSTPRGKGYIMEYKAGRVFEDWVMQDRHTFTQSEIYSIAFELLDIIEILQQHGIVHGDIRLPNVIITPKNELALIDFGLARFIDNRRYVKQMDYWYLGDFLLHLYYTRFQRRMNPAERPWYNELNLNDYEKYFIKRLVGLEKDYDTVDDIRFDLHRLMYLL